MYSVLSLTTTAASMTLAVYAQSSSSSSLFAFDGPCGGPSLAGYCCPGSIINPSGDLFNNGDDSVDGVICCVGDPSGAINNSPLISTCSIGSATPLAKAPTSTTLSPISDASISVPGVTISGITTGGVTIDGTTIKGGNPTATMTSQSDETNAAQRAMVTAGRVIGGAAIAAMALV